MSLVPKIDILKLLVLFQMKKIIRSSTVPGSLHTFCKDLLRELREEEEFDVVAVSSPGDELDEVGEREGVRTCAVKMARRISPLADLKSLCNMVRVFRRERPVMVHSMTPKAGLLSMIAGWLCDVPVRVHTFTGLVFPTSSGFKRKLLMMTDRITCACATHVIPEGEGVKRDLQRFGITKKPLKVLGHGNIRGIDLEQFDPVRPDVREKSQELRNPGVFTFVYIGRLVGDKGINELVTAFSRLNKEIPATRLILIGNYEREIDPLKAETMAEIERNQAIEAVGPKNDVRPWLLASDACILPSYREGFPNVVIEAGAMGLPSIVTDINGANEIIIDGENGVIVPPKDAYALESAMKDFIDNPNKVREMGAKARPLIASRYEQSYVRQCLKDFYREILKDR